MLQVPTFLIIDKIFTYPYSVFTYSNIYQLITHQIPRSTLHYYSVAPWNKLYVSWMLFHVVFTQQFVNVIFVWETKYHKCYLSGWYFHCDSLKYSCVNFGISELYESRRSHIWHQLSLKKNLPLYENWWSNTQWKDFYILTWLMECNRTDAAEGLFH